MIKGGKKIFETSSLLRSYKGLKPNEDEKMSRRRKRLLRSYKGLKQACCEECGVEHIVFITFL